ncbi:uncharacterized protein EDB91DRAFT_1098826 [Suillus paluster]|uniref:uncharacterized protein n=1 Tax=Suillus paluster TaxID=48578 RepID=UPI001B86722F|nr:uncharacterized protein EDB91DRAFT_1098826 [Suillus paluster]KAG1753603.1 hypothetical protein EDB91DRAFT_1098826 [Suillus paluster]
MTIAFPAHDMDVPKGWTTLVHPEGFRYFVHKENRTFTDLDICDPVICDDIEYYMQYLFDELRRTVGLEKLDMNQVDLVLEPKVFDGDSVVCCYYFVNHRNRCLFWLDDFHAEHNPLRVFACKKHWDYFPSLCPVAQDLVDEVKNTLAHAACDHLTSKQSSAAFDTIHDPADQSMRRCHAAIVIGRVMYSFSHNHFVNYHGEDCARLIFEQTVHDTKYQTSLWMAILTPLLFFYPMAQIHELHKIYVDEIVCTGRWNVFSSKFKGQLQDSNLLATVLLNANVGFLAINTVDKGGRDAIQMASYMSLVTSLGSIVLGLFFVSHGRISAQNTAEEVANFLSSLHDEKHSLEKLAVIFSLPKALLMWGMLFFFAAFSIDWWTAGDITSRTIVGTVTLVVFAMVSNNITGPWRSTLLHRGIGLTLLSRLGDVWKQIMEFTGIEKNLVGPLPEDAEVDAPQPHDVDPVLPSSDSHTNPGFLSGASSLQQIREDTPTVFQDQSTIEARCERDISATAATATILSEHELQTAAVAVDTDAPILPGSFCTEEREDVKYTENVVEEPGELDHPQPSLSTTPPPRIFARSATNDYFHHAPAAPKWTLEDGHDIEECQE